MANVFKNAFPPSSNDFPIFDQYWKNKNCGIYSFFHFSPSFKQFLDIIS
jgi:hypothetical protein